MTSKSEEKTFIQLTFLLVELSSKGGIKSDRLSLSVSQIQGMPWTGRVFNHGGGDVTDSAWSSKVLSVSLNLLHANAACVPAPLSPVFHSPS